MFEEEYFRNQKKIKKFFREHNNLTTDRMKMPVSRKKMAQYSTK